MDGDTGLEVIPSISPATGVLKLHIWTPAIGLLPLLLQRLAGNRGLQNLSWQPGVGAREEVPKGASQALTGNKSYSSRLWSVQLSIASFKSLSLPRSNKYGSSFICLFYAVGIDLEG